MAPKEQVPLLMVVAPLVLLAQTATTTPVHDPQGLYRKAVEEVQANKLEQAAADLEKMVRVQPQFEPAYTLLGVCYARLGKLELAQKAFQRSVRLNPRSAEAHTNLGTSHLSLGKPREALAEFQAALALDRKNAAALSGLGRAHLDLKQPSAAIDALQQGRTLSPQDPEIVLALADAYFLEHEPKKAETLLEEAGLHEGMLEVANHHIERGDYRRALDVLLPLKEKLSRLAAFHGMVGFVYSRLGEPIPAIESLQSAMRLDPQNENYFLDLAQVLEENNAHKAAAELLQSAILMHPGSGRLHVGLSLAYIPAGRLPEARAAAQKALSLDPTLQTAYTTLAMIHEEERDWPSLLSLSQRLQKLNPNNYLGWYYAGVAQAAVRENESGGADAVQSFRHALKLNPSFPVAHYQLGKLYWEQGNNQAAIEELNRAIKENPDYVEAHFLLAKAYSKAGDAKRSREEFEIHRKLVAAQESRRRPHLEVKINPPVAR